ncbi:cytochrome P450 [Ophiobolus disseminans]|uniref:Cytochrome P450 n=1 Tax=Ophiobolus disseminans TaxID=1469910 RepID=A0A6A6ZP04_9PLEO|nr:cytochrome P450 [Ophiobolus disseminans]
MELTAQLLELSATILLVIVAAILSRVLYMHKFHCLSSFPGPWYATSFSIVSAIISIKEKEPEWLLYLVRMYGSDRPIRISPNLLLFPRPSALRDIYWDPKCNVKGGLYATRALGPPHLFSTIDTEEHRILRKALSNAPWTIGQLRKAWEPQFDDQVNLFIKKMCEHAAAKRALCLSDKVAEFAADIMSMISFTKPFGAVENQRDEKDILGNWRTGLFFFGFVARCRFFREDILALPRVAAWFLPRTSDDSGMGWLMREAERQVAAREKTYDETQDNATPDFLQHCLNARMPDGSPLTRTEKRAHVTLLIQAGADTTGTALGSILRFIITHPPALERAQAEIASADQAGYLSNPIQFEETRKHLPYFIACIKEGLRLNPPAPNLFSRVVPRGGKILDGHFVPAGTEVTSHAYTTQRDREFYGDDAMWFVPERWMVNEKRTFELEAAQFTFGVGPRTCLGKDIAMMEMYKLLPEIVRRFNFELQDTGRFVVVGGVAYNKSFLGRLVARL